MLLGVVVSVVVDRLFRSVRRRRSVSRSRSRRAPVAPSAKTPAVTRVMVVDSSRAAGQSRPSGHYAEAPQSLLVGRWGHVLREYIPLVRLGLGVF